MTDSLNCQCQDKGAVAKDRFVSEAELVPMEIQWLWKTSLKWITLYMGLVLKMITWMKVLALKVKGEDCEACSENQSGYFSEYR